MNHPLSLLAVLTVFFASGCATQRLYCNFYEGRDSVSDRMVILTQTSSGERKLNISPFWTVGMRFYKTYDEGQEIITVYKERRENRFSLFKVDLSDPLRPLFLYGYGLYLPNSKEFERIYSLPFTSKNFRSINAKPELEKYLPEKPEPKYLSITFYKRKLKCRHIKSYIEYMKEFARLCLYYLLAA